MTEPITTSKFIHIHVHLLTENVTNVDDAYVFSSIDRSFFRPCRGNLLSIQKLNFNASKTIECQLINDSWYLARSRRWYFSKALFVLHFNTIPGYGLVIVYTDVRDSISKSLFTLLTRYYNIKRLKKVKVLYFISIRWIKRSCQDGKTNWR